jgi:hypothetical protein
MHMPVSKSILLFASGIGVFAFIGGFNACISLIRTGLVISGAGCSMLMGFGLGILASMVYQDWKRPMRSSKG